MDAAHVHLILTHFPIVGTFIGLGILLYGLFVKNDQVKIAALACFIVMSILTIPVFLSGEGAEETVEQLAGVSERVIETHEELAEKAIWLMGALGISSLIGLVSIMRRASLAMFILMIVLLLSLATFGLFAKVGNLGGQIRHTEIRSTTGELPLEKNNNFRDYEEDDD